MHCSGRDSRCTSIAAASILAKQYRDQLMIGAAEQFPDYGWDRNKGYPTKAHKGAIERHGITPSSKAALTQKTELLTIPLGCIITR